MAKFQLSLEFMGYPKVFLVDENLNILKKFIGPLNKEEYKNILKLTS